MTISDFDDLADLANLIDIAQRDYEGRRLSVAVGWHPGEEKMEGAIKNPMSSTGKHDARYSHNIYAMELISDISRALGEGTRVNILIGRGVRRSYVEHYAARNQEPPLDIITRDLEEDYSWEREEEPIFP